MKNSEDLGNIISLSKIGQKIFEIKGKYHPNLIANLSREAYDLYVIRMSICDQLLEQLDKKGITVEKIEDFIKNKMKESKEQLDKAKDEMESELIQLTIKEWKDFYKYMK